MNENFVKTRISVRNLVEFVLRCGDLQRGFVSSSRLTEARHAHQSIQQTSPENYAAEVYLSHTIEDKDFVLQIDGRADGIITTADGTIIDEIKSTALLLHEIHEEHNILHWAQANCYAYIYATKNDLPEITTQLTYYQIKTHETKQFSRYYSIEDLKEFFDDIVIIYLKWLRVIISWQKQRDDSIASLNFPFSQYREGQQHLQQQVFVAIQQQKKLFVQAPTGIGKTIAVIYPALQALSQGTSEKIFYLTAKTIVRTTVEETFAQMRNQGLHCKSLTLTARDKICFQSRCIPEECEYAKGYFGRINQAVEDIFQEPVFTREVILEYAQRHKVCPFEFSLELALWADCIICDYNYVFDPRVYLRRFFDRSGKYCLLIDEAHNLPDRVRDMYSAELNKSAILQLKRATKQQSPKLSGVLQQLNAKMLELKKHNAPQKLAVFSEIPENIAEILEELAEAIEIALANQISIENSELLFEVYFAVLHFLKIAQEYDEHYITYLEQNSREVTIKLYCLNPAILLEKLFKRGKSVVLFSATLLPLEYYFEILAGQPQDHTVCLDSPFPRKNFGLFVIDNIATSYQKRSTSYHPIAQCIALTVQRKKGNYLVFFPSYKYMENVVTIFHELFPNIKSIVQSPQMTEQDREAFLANFHAENSQSLVGFAVMGGIFSEGIDLTGERLCGAIVIGVGLPQVCAERNVIRDYFDKNGKNGFAYSYIYPGMNKVMQAVGRVIRDTSDIGIAVLIDERFAWTNYHSLFPSHWIPYKTLRNTQELINNMDDFWRKSRQ